MRSIKAMVIDDEQEAKDVLLAMLKKIPEIDVVATASDVDSAILEFLEHKPDIVFLDVQMPRKDGFAFVEALHTSLNDTTIIFITAYQRYAIDAIKHSAFDFLLKPVAPLELIRAIDRYKEKHKFDKPDIGKLLDNLKKNNKVKLKTRTGFELINSEEIIYIEAESNYAHVHMLLDREFVVTQTLKNLKSILGENAPLLQISRSTVINTNFLVSFDRIHRKCKLIAGQNAFELKVSRERLKEFDKI